MRCVSLYFKAFTQKMLSPFLLWEILTGVIKVYGSDMDVPVCPAASSLFLSLQAEAACFALLLFQLGSWCLIPFFLADRRASAALPRSQEQLRSFWEGVRQLWDCNHGTLLPHSKAAMSMISRAGCSRSASFQSKTWGLSMVTRTGDGWVVSTVKGAWKSGAVCYVGP